MREAAHHPGRHSKTEIGTSNRDISLDMIRGTAILLALGWHFNAPTGNRLLDPFLLPGRTMGWAGVDLFFVLSGFLIGRIIIMEQLVTRTFDYKRFFVRRAMRLWPALYSFLAVQFLLGTHPWESYLLQTVF